MSSLLCRSVFVKEFHTIRVFLNIRWSLGSTINSNHLWMNVRFLRNWLSGAFSKAGQMFAVGWVIMTELRWLDLFFCWFFLNDPMSLRFPEVEKKSWSSKLQTVMILFPDGPEFFETLTPSPSTSMHFAHQIPCPKSVRTFGIRNHWNPTEFRHYLHDGASNRCSSDFLMYIYCIYYIYFSFNK